MKNLYIMRHAQAVSREGRGEDRLRELSQRGVRDALFIGNWLRERAIPLDLIVHSSASRTTQTAELVAEALKKGDSMPLLAEDVLYEASVRLLLQYIREIEDGYRDVLVVAHNPAVSYLAEYLTKADTGGFPAGALAIIRFDHNSWKNVDEGTGTLEEFVAP